MLDLRKCRERTGEDSESTSVFDAMLEHVIDNYPNPQRVGCFDRAILEKIFSAPDPKELEDPKYIHIVECAECAQVLRDLRRQKQVQSVALHKSFDSMRSTLWRPSWVALFSVLLLAALTGLGWFYHRHVVSQNLKETAALETIDLSQETVPRGLSSPEQTLFSLPRHNLKLHLILPYYSEGGAYTVEFVSDSQPSIVLMTTSGIAKIQGAHTELTVDLDLRRLGPGRYDLITRQMEKSTSRTYPMDLK